MKHTWKITAVLLAMFFLAQLIGIAVMNVYSPQTQQVTAPDGNQTNVTIYNLPYGMEPPAESTPKNTLYTIIFSFLIAVTLIFVLMKIKAELFLRIWFFVVVSIALAITFNSALKYLIPYASLFALVFSLVLAFYKIFKRNIIIHNITEVLIYPGIAAIFVSLLSIPTVVILLILISLYDIYAVWHAGFMQKMAHYQIKTLKVFSGFFVPYLNKKQKDMLKNVKTKSKSLKNKKIKVSIALLGGGDVVFPMILAGVVLHALGFIPALIISLGATLALGLLFYYSEKGKFYPAMPFISAGCLVALGIVYFIF
jgi:presenilin-like A22 family membrane protease